MQSVSFTVSAVDPVFGQRVNCGGYATIAEAVAYVERKHGSREYRHQIHQNPAGMGLIDTPPVWESLNRRPPFDPTALRALVCRSRFGFVTGEELEQLAAHPTSRLWQLLVRCGSCRFLAAAQDVMHICAALTAAGDYVRDVAFPASVDFEGSRR